MTKINGDIYIGEIPKQLKDLQNLFNYETNGLVVAPYNWDGTDENLKNLFLSLNSYSINIGAFYKGVQGSGFYIGSNEATYGFAHYLVGINHSLRLFVCNNFNWTISTIV